MAYLNHEDEQEYDVNDAAYADQYAGDPQYSDEADEDDWLEDEPGEDYGDEWEDDMDAIDREERRLRRRDQMRVAAGVGDFFGVIVGMVCILLIIALLVSLVNWLLADISSNFVLWQNKL